MDTIQGLVSALSALIIVGSITRLAMLGINAMSDTDSVDKSTYKRQARNVVVVLIVAVIVFTGSLPSLLLRYFPV